MRLDEIRRRYEEGSISDRINLEHDCFLKLLSVAEAAASLAEHFDIVFHMRSEPIKRALAALEAE